MNEEQRNNLADKLSDCMEIMQMQLVAIDATSVVSSCESQYKLFKDFMELLGIKIKELSLILMRLFFNY